MFLARGNSSLDLDGAESSRESAVICPSCHTDVQEGNAFCGKCGAALTATAAAHSPYLRNYGAAASGVLLNIGARLSAFTSTGKREGFSLR